MATVKIKPLADRVLVEPAPAEEKTAAGIIIPDTAKEKPQKGTVVAVGTGKKDEPKINQTGKKWPVKDGLKRWAYNLRTGTDLKNKITTDKK